MMFRLPISTAHARVSRKKSSLVDQHLTKKEVGSGTACTRVLGPCGPKLSIIKRSYGPTGRVRVRQVKIIPPSLLR